MSHHDTLSVQVVLKFLVDSIRHNFALKLISLILAVMLYFFLKPDAATRTPAVEKITKAIAVGAGMEAATEPAATNETAAVSAPAAATNATNTATEPEPRTNGKN